MIGVCKRMLKSMSSDLVKSVLLWMSFVSFELIWLRFGGDFEVVKNWAMRGKCSENRRFCKEKGAVTSSLERLFFLTRKITENYLFGGSLLFWHFIVSNSQYHSIPVSITRHSPEKLFSNIHIFI